MSTASSSPQAASEQPGLPEDAVEVGRIMGAWGIKGGIRVKPFAADPQALFSSKRWFVQPPEGQRLARPAAGTLPSLLRVASAREQGDSVVATIHDLDNRSAAEALKGARIFVARSSFPTPDADEYYWIDLIGLAVVNRAGLALGSVAGLIETGPHCVIRVRADGAAEAQDTLIPFVDAYVDKVDLPARLITVDWDPEY